jgi:hypothetical protein
MAACGGAVEGTGSPSPASTTPPVGTSPPSATNPPTTTTANPPTTVPTIPPPIGRDLCTTKSGSSVLDGFEPFANLSLPTPVDYIEVREEPLASDPGGAQSVAEASWGTACLAASSTACLESLESPFTGTAWPGYFGRGFGSTQRDIRYTRSASAGVVSDLKGYLGLFGAIDTPEKAALLADLEGYRLKCDAKAPAPNAFNEGNGIRLVMIWANDWSCPYPAWERNIQVKPDGSISVLSEAETKLDWGCAGRRPEGFACPAANATSSVGAWLSQMATLEAASVPAFLRLARELEAHGAPHVLVDRARASADDEVRHHALMRDHAQRFGACLVESPSSELGVRALFDVALENAVEGCVRETFGALIATFQAERADDAELAKTLREIADDETRHAALSWDCAAWANTQLAEDERAAIARAKRSAVDDLRVSLNRDNDDEVVRAAGLPTRTEALALLALVEHELARAA